jgi:hypothetical protein
MPCETVKFDDGTTAIVCTRGTKRKVCRWCARTHTKLCDYPLRGAKAGKTCSAEMCDAHAHEVGPDQHFCPPHREMWERDGCKLKL